MKVKIMLCILNAYEKEGIADINFDNLRCTGMGKDTMIKHINQLIYEGHVVDLHVNGFFPRYQVITKVGCPNFLFDDLLTIGNKVTLMEAVDKLTSYEHIPIKALARAVFGEDSKKNGKRFYDIKENTGRTVFEYLETLEYVKKDTFHYIHELKETEFGLQVSNNKKIKTNSDCLCQYCGETEPLNFYSGSRITCKSCKDKREKEDHLEHPEKLLMNRVRASSQQRRKLKMVIITAEDIKEQLEKQEYKDYYTGLLLDDVEMMSVDRIDSNKFYEVGNIVITHRKINLMKNDMTIIEFKSFIKNLADNLENF